MNNRQTGEEPGPYSRNRKNCTPIVCARLAQQVLFTLANRSPLFRPFLNVALLSTLPGRTLPDVLPVIPSLTASTYLAIFRYGPLSLSLSLSIYIYASPPIDLPKLRSSTTWHAIPKENIIFAFASPLTHDEN